MRIEASIGNDRRRRQRDHRGAARRPTDQVRDRQGSRDARGRPVPVHVDGLSGQLRLRPHTLPTTATDRRARLRPRPLVAGCVINVRPIGVLMMEDKAGMDEKVIAVPGAPDAALRQGEELQRRAEDHAAADRALLRALQGSRRGQVGEDREGEGGRRMGGAARLRAPPAPHAATRARPPTARARGSAEACEAAARAVPARARRARRRAARSRTRARPAAPW